VAQPRRAKAGAGADAIEARSDLAPWTRFELTPAPSPKGLQWLGVVGPGVIVLGAWIGSGEFLLGPAAFVRYGLTLLWVSGLAIVLQTIFNTELLRYTLATGEPIFTGFMRTKPRTAEFVDGHIALRMKTACSVLIGILRSSQVAHSSELRERSPARSWAITHWL
jgi:hypothetical protein